MGNQTSRNRNRQRVEQPPQQFAYPPPQQVNTAPQVCSPEPKLVARKALVNSPSVVPGRACSVWASGYEQWANVRWVETAGPIELCGELQKRMLRMLLCTGVILFMC